jgi:hypothetical protein
MQKKTVPRAWYYFRMGWSTYFAFIFAAINTLVVTYYLAIEKYPPLLEIFPTFPHYVVIVVSIGIPLLVAVGYSHFKKTTAFKSETAISIESNPFQRRIIVNTELMLTMNQLLTNLILKIAKNDKIDDQELTEIKNLQKQMGDIIEKRTMTNDEETKFVRNLTRNKF